MERRVQKSVKATIAIAIVLAIMALILGVIFPHQNEQLGEADKLSYDNVAPILKQYLEDEKLVSATGTLIVPSTNSSSAGSSGVTEITVEQAVRNLIANGELSYIKGETGARGLSGARGETGAAGSNANISTTDGSGLTYSGGVISLKTCAVDQVLMSNGTTWDCASIGNGSAGGAAAGTVDNNTTTIAASLIKTGTTLQVTINDSAGNVVETNTVDLGETFPTTAQLSNYATTANVNDLSERVSKLESAGYLTETKAAATYVTSSELNTKLADYATTAGMNSALSSYLLKSEFHQTLAANLIAGTGIALTDSNGQITISSTVNDDIFVTTTNHLNETAPNPNKIYLDSSTSPMSEWIYLNGKNGAPTTPSDPAAWLKIGDLQVDLSRYSTTSEMNSAIANSIRTNLNDLAANSNLNSILADYVKTAQLNSAIATESSNTRSWVSSQGYLTSSALSTYATQKWVEDQAYAKKSDLLNYYTMGEVDNKLAAKASQATVDTLANTVAGKQNKLVAGNNITITGDTISAAIDTTGFATQSWVEGQGYLTKTTADATYAKAADTAAAAATKQDKLPTCGNGQVVKFNTSNALWECADDKDTTYDLTANATRTWVEEQNYLTNQKLANYLTQNGYVTNAAMSSALTDYVLKSQFATMLNQNLKAGTNITISADNTISAVVDTNSFITTSNHLAETNPNPNKIYINTSSTPAIEYIYKNGQDGAPTDPANPAAWAQLGENSFDASKYYTKSETDKVAADAASSRLNDLGTNSNINSILSDYVKNAQMSSAISSATSDMATKTWVNSQNYITTAALTDYVKTAEMNTALSNKQDRLPTCSAGQVVKYSTTAPNWVCAADNDTTYDLSTNATKEWVTGQGYLTKTEAASTYATQSAVSTALAGKQNTITGAATTITDANLTAGRVLQSDTNGKVQASSVLASDIAVVVNNWNNAMSSINNLQNQNNNATNYGVGAEVDTGRTFNGKKVYRQTFVTCIAVASGTQSNIRLMDVGVETIVNTGGNFMTGNQKEQYEVGANYAGTDYGFVIMFQDGTVGFRSRSGSTRNGAASGSTRCNQSSGGEATIIVDYTKTNG